MFTHHAYLVEGGDDATAHVRAHVEKAFGASLSGNPDFLYLAYESFGVDESRGLKEMASRKPIGERKAVIIRSNVFTHEAQNALLKLFEEPTPHTHFFVVTPYPRALLPTLRSRMEMFTRDGIRNTRTESREMALAREARAGDVRQRMAMAADLSEDEENKTRAVRFLEALTEILDGELRGARPVRGRPLAAAGSNGARTKELERAFFAASNAASYARDRGASLKILLEYAVLSLPGRS